MEEVKGKGKREQGQGTAVGVRLYLSRRELGRVAKGERECWCRGGDSEWDQQGPAGTGSGRVVVEWRLRTRGNQGIPIRRFV